MHTDLTPQIIHQKVEEHASSADNCKTQWNSIKKDINNNIDKLKREIATSITSKDGSVIPEQKLLLKKIKHFSESQLKELHKYKRGAVTDSDHSIPQQIRITAGLAKKTVSKVSHELQTSGFFFRKSEKEMSADIKKANEHTNALAHKVTDLKTQIHGLEAGYLNLMKRTKTVSECLQQEQQLVEQCHHEYEKGIEELKHFNKGKKGSSFNRDLVINELASNLQILHDMKKGLANSAQLDDNQLLETFNDGNANDRYISVHKIKFKETKATINALIKTMHEIEVRDEHKHAAKVKRKSISLFAHRQTEDTQTKQIKPPIASTYIDILNNIQRQNDSLQNVLDNLSKEPKKNHGLIQLLEKKQIELGVLEKEILKEKIQPHTFGQETNKVAEANHKLEYVKIAEKMHLGKSDIPEAVLHGAIENAVSANRAQQEAKVVLEHLKKKGNSPLNVVLVGDIRSRIEQMKMIGEKRLNDIDQLTPERIAHDQKTIIECDKACSEILKASEDEKKIDDRALKFTKIAAEWMNTEFGFSFALQGYLHQVDQDPQFFHHFPKEDRELMQNFVRTAREVVETSMTVSQSMAAQARKAFTNAKGNIVDDLTAVFNQPFASEQGKEASQRHMLALSEHVKYGSMISENPKHAKWTQELEKSDHWSPEDLSARMVNEDYLQPPKDVLGDFAIRGTQLIMRYILLSKEAKKLGEQAASDAKFVDNVFNPLIDQGEKLSKDMNDYKTEQLNIKLEPLMKKHASSIKKCKEATLKKCVKIMEEKPRTAPSSIVLQGREYLREWLDKNGMGKEELKPLVERIEKEVMVEIQALYPATKSV